MLLKHCTLIMTVMTAIPAPTYVEIAFDPNTEAISFSDTICGTVRPGSLDYLTKLRVIYWQTKWVECFTHGAIT